MLTGEPYLINYLKTIDKTMKNYNFTKFNYIKNHVNYWNLIKKNEKLF